MDRRTGTAHALTSRTAILTVTLNPAIDLHLEINAFRRAELVRAVAAQRSAGGKGVNVSRMLAALGVRSTAACVLGGPDAEVYCELTRPEPFELAVLQGEGPTRTNLTLATPAGKHLLKVNQPGPRISRSGWRRVEESLGSLMEGREWVVISGALLPGMPASSYARLTRIAHALGAKVAVDCEGEPLRRALASRPELLKPNRVELATILQHTPPSAPRGAMQLLKMGARAVIVSDGPQRVWFLENGRIWSAQPPRVNTAKAMRGGDALVAGAIAALLEDRTPEQALKLGVACGTAAVAASGAHPVRIGYVRELEGRVTVRSHSLERFSARPVA